MEVKPGYKQTEVGVIPEEWDARPLGEIGGVRMCKRVFKDQTREIGDVPFYKIGTFGDVPDAFISQELFDEFKRKYSFPRKGDVLISAAGTIGRTVVYDGAPAYFQDSNIVWIDNDQSKATNEYLRHYYQVTKWSVSHGGTVARLYNDNLKNKIYVATPPLPEQRAIATALSDVDGLLGGLDRLIAKKHDLKQAAMQQLLTGQTRLPGFHGEWEVKELGSVCNQVTTGKLDANAMSSNGEYRFYTCAKDFYYIDNYAFDCEALLISGNGANVGYIHYYKGKFNAYQRTYVLSDFSVSINYIQHYLSQKLAERIEVEVKAGGTPYITRSTITEMFINLPPSIAEQTAIAEVLSDMDAELAALEQRRDKTRALKQAMMQELLTGRIRLV